MQYFVDGYPAEKRADAKVFDAGAGTGMVARGVGTRINLTLIHDVYLGTSKRKGWQKVPPLMKCHSMWHFIMGCIVCLYKVNVCGLKT